MSIANKLHKVQYVCTLCTPSFRGIFLFSRRDAAILIDDLYPPAAHSGTPAAAPPPLPGLWTRNCSFQGQAAACLIVSAQPTGRGRSHRQRAPRGRARRAGGTYKGRRAGFRSKSEKTAPGKNEGSVMLGSGKTLLCTRPQLLLRLADFCGAPRRALAKTGALRQLRLAASAAGSAWLSCKRRLRCTEQDRR